ncbi:cupin domain-containing protein [Mailhella massiliensis]|uniref:(R)-mandelonitrile lyase n=1 Tax=Mailhella massiliensis TaxID=1903261 RepID=UPI0009FA6BFC|nr:cupin domain-containing protein [Mailhella massiliensis]
MKNTVTRMLFVLFAATVAFPGQAPASETGRAQTIIRNGEQAALKGSAQYFTGNVRIDPLYPANGDMRSSGGSVTFEPGARSHWHIHPVGQALIVTSGVGLTQEWGKPVQEIRPGDVVLCPVGVKHWHGASPNSSMTHISICEEKEPGKVVEWLEEVTDEQYNAR